MLSAGAWKAVSAHMSHIRIRNRCVTYAYNYMRTIVRIRNVYIYV